MNIIKDEKSFAVLSQTGEKERTRQKSKAEKEKSEAEQRDTVPLIFDL